MNSSVNIKNKKAKYDYSLLDSYTCGIVLTGNEIKSIRNSKASLNNSYCEYTDGELFVINLHIDQYENSSEQNYDPKRKRKLLLNRQELKKIEKDVRDIGITVVATSLFISKKGIAKLNISVPKGKREFDKRNVIKDRENKISLKRIKKNFNNQFLFFSIGTNRKFPKVSFFNSPALTTTIPAQFVKKYDCQIVPLYIERIDKYYFKVKIDKPFELNQNHSIEQISETLNRWLEKKILNNPNQWIWSHNRWK